MAKAKPTKHTAGELAAKAKAATQNAGGGKAGLQDQVQVRHSVHPAAPSTSVGSCIQCAYVSSICSNCAPPPPSPLPRHRRCHICAQQAPDLKTMQVGVGAGTSSWLRAPGQAAAGCIAIDLCRRAHSITPRGSGRMPPPHSPPAARCCTCRCITTPSTPSCPGSRRSARTCTRRRAA